MKGLFYPGDRGFMGNSDDLISNPSDIIKPIIPSVPDIVPQYDEDGDVAVNWIAYPINFGISGLSTADNNDVPVYVGFASSKYRVLNRYDPRNMPTVPSLGGTSKYKPIAFRSDHPLYNIIKNTRVRFHVYPTTVDGKEVTYYIGGRSGFSFPNFTFNTYLSQQAFRQDIRTALDDYGYLLPKYLMSYFSTGLITDPEGLTSSGTPSSTFPIGLSYGTDVTALVYSEPKAKNAFLKVLSEKNGVLNMCEYESVDSLTDVYRQAFSHKLEHGLYSGIYGRLPFYSDMIFDRTEGYSKYMGSSSVTNEQKALPNGKPLNSLASTSNHVFSKYFGFSRSDWMNTINNLTLEYYEFLSAYYRSPYILCRRYNPFVYANSLHATVDGKNITGVVGDFQSYLIFLHFLGLKMDKQCKYRDSSVGGLSNPNWFNYNGYALPSKPSITKTFTAFTNKYRNVTNTSSENSGKSGYIASIGFDGSKPHNRHCDILDCNFPYDPYNSIVPIYPVTSAALNTAETANITSSAYRFSYTVKHTFKSAYCYEMFEGASAMYYSVNPVVVIPVFFAPCRDRNKKLTQGMLGTFREELNPRYAGLEDM